MSDLSQRLERASIEEHMDEGDPEVISKVSPRGVEATGAPPFIKRSSATEDLWSDLGAAPAAADGRGPGRPGAPGRVERAAVRRAAAPDRADRRRRLGAQLLFRGRLDARALRHARRRVVGRQKLLLGRRRAVPRL